MPICVQTGLHLCCLQMHKISFIMMRFQSFHSSRHGLQRRMISVDNFFVFLRLLFFALFLLYVT